MEVIDKKKLPNNKVKALINDLITFDEKNNNGVISIENNVMECKKLQKQLKIKDTNLAKKKEGDTKTQKDEILLIKQKLNDVYSERRNILNMENRSDAFVKSKITLFSTLIKNYTKEAESDETKKNYECYVTSQKNNNNAKGNTFSIEEYRDKIIGKHNKSKKDRKIVYELNDLYSSLKGSTDTNEKWHSIMEAETKYFSFNANKNIKKLNKNYINVFVDNFNKIVDLFIKSINNNIYNYNNNNISCENNNKSNITDFNKFLNLISYNNFNSYVHKKIFNHHDKFTYFINKSKDEKNVEIDCFNAMCKKPDIKGFNEKNEIIKYVIEKNILANHMNKYFKDISIDNKTKKFITYIIVCEFYNKIEPFLKLSKSCIVEKYMPDKDPETKKTIKGSKVLKSIEKCILISKIANKVIDQYISNKITEDIFIDM